MLPAFRLKKPRLSASKSNSYSLLSLPNLILQDLSRKSLFKFHLENELNVDALYQKSIFGVVII